MNKTVNSRERERERESDRDKDNKDELNDNSVQINSSKSFLNLTTSALAGVFGSQVSLAELNGDVTNANTSAQPSRSPSQPGIRKTNYNLDTINEQYSKKTPSTLNLTICILILFAFGVAYGQFCRHLHDNHQITSYTLDIDQTGAFSLLWGSQGIILGFLLPFFDWMMPDKNRKWDHGKGGADWTSIVRAAAAFMGIAYGIRKLSWTSSLQAAFYWGMVNPCLWFLMDGTRNGFILSCLTAIVGTTVFAIVFPSHLPLMGVNEEYVAVVSWVASVFFCCSISFGNAGRRLLAFDAKHLDL